MIFVIAFDRSTNQLLAFDTFADAERVASETRYRELLRHTWLEAADDSVEVNVFESIDEDTFRKTHARYFESTSDAIKSLRSALQ